MYKGRRIGSVEGGENVKKDERKECEVKASKEGKGRWQAVNDSEGKLRKERIVRMKEGGRRSRKKGGERNAAPPEAAVLGWDGIECHRDEGGWA